MATPKKKLGTVKSGKKKVYNKFEMPSASWWESYHDGEYGPACIPTPFIITQPNEIPKPINCEPGTITARDPSRIERLEKQVADLIAILAKVVK